MLTVVQNSVAKFPASFFRVFAGLGWIARVNAKVSLGGQNKKNDIILNSALETI